MLQADKNIIIKNKINDFHPISAFIYLIGLFLCIFLSSGRHFLTLSVILGIFTFLAILNGFFKTLKSLLFGLATIVFVILITMASYHQGEHIIIYINDNPITLEGFFKGLENGLFIILIMLFFKMFGILLTGGKFIFLFGRIFPTVSLMISMVLSYSEGYSKGLGDIISAQSSLGVSVKNGGFIRKIKNSAGIFSGFIGYMLENSLDTASSMKARGYTGKNPMYNPYSFKHKDSWLLILSIIITLVLFILTHCGENYLIICVQWLLTALFSLLPLILTVLPLKKRGHRYEYSKC